MEYPTNDEEFYELISKNLNELVWTDNFPISPEEKKKLWMNIYETAQRYEEQKQIDLEGKSKQLGIAFQNMYEGLARLFSKISEGLPELEGIVANMKMTKSKMNEVSQNIYLAKERIKEISENMQNARMNMNQTREILRQVREKQEYLEGKIDSWKKGEGKTEDVDEVHKKVNEVNSTVQQIIEGMKNQREFK